jgi:hypothetical protein
LDRFPHQGWEPFPRGDPFRAPHTYFPSVAPIDERRSRLPPIQYEDYEDYRSEDCTVIGSALMVLGDNYGANEYVNLLKNIPCADTEVVVPREMRSLPPDFHQHRRIEDAHPDPNTLVLLACSVDETPHNLRRALVHGFRRIVRLFRKIFNILEGSSFHEMTLYFIEI